MSITSEAFVLQIVLGIAELKNSDECALLRCPHVPLLDTKFKTVDDLVGLLWVSKGLQTRVG